MNSKTARTWRRLLVAGACVVLGACGGGSGSEDEQPIPPAAPTSLTATAAGHSRVDLAWSDRSSDESGFRIERSSTSASAGFVAVHATGSNESLWGDTSVSPDTHYWYRVRATNAAGDSAWSNVADATTDPAPVAAPTDLTAVATSPLQVQLTWVDHAANEDGFELQRSTTSATAGFEQLRLAAADATAAIDPVSPNMAYWYRIRAYNNQGTSGWSNVATVTTPTGLPGAPTGVVATPTSPTTIALTWTAPAFGNPTGFLVEYRTGGGGWISGCGASATSCTVTGLSQSTSYEFRVTASNAFGYGSPSTIAAATTPSGLPGAPTGVVATATSPTTIALTWTAPAVGDPTGFLVEYRTGGGGWVSGCGASATSCTVTGLSPSTSYEFRVTASNAFGYGPPSTIAAATTPSGLPGAPTVAAATPTSPTTVDLTWAAPVFGAPNFYSVEYRTNLTNWTAGCGVSALSCTVAGLSQSTSYEFRVIAYNAFGYGPPSTSATATTPSGLPGAPTGVVATATSPTTVDLTWVAPVFGEPTYYSVEYRTNLTNWSAACGVSALSCTVPGLSQSTTYEFRVTAYNNFGTGPPSASASATTPSGLPGAPTGVVATATSSTTVDVTWIAPAFGDPTYYSVEYRTNLTNWSAACGVNALSCTLLVLAPDTTYSFRVLAYNDFGYGPPSDIATATTPP